MGSHQHQRDNGASHTDFDPGAMYKQQWVQDLIRKLQEFLRTNVAWLGIEPSKKQRVLDYACGHGTISLALVDLCPHTTFQGIDSHPKQVQRFNEEARKLLDEGGDRMYAIEGDLSNSSSVLDQPEWFDFNVAIISMALHHVPEPIDMLTHLRKRLINGGTLIVTEWFYADHPSRKSKSGNDQDPKGMIEVVGGQKIWDGFTPNDIRAMLVDAGFKDVVMELLDGTLPIPDHIDSPMAGIDRKLMFVRAIAP